MNMSSLATKDPAFKLFGRNIPLPTAFIPVKDSCSEITKEDTECPDEANPEERREGKEETQASIQGSDSPVSSSPRQDQAETNSTNQEKILKKPDKIIPCPRCDSLETKFGYFNNYNVNQPRHFCKNCQRYWTAGGTMRNVPIGAGRRKNKHLASQYRQILVSSDGMPVTRIANADSSNPALVSVVDSTSPLRPPTGTTPVVLKFGPEAPLCESMENVLNLGEQKKYAELTSVRSQSNREVPFSSVSSVSASAVQGNDSLGIVMKKQQISGSSKETKGHRSMHCYPIPPLVFPWNPGWTNPGQSRNQNGSIPGQLQWCPTPMVAVPGFCPPNIPVQFFPASYWGCMPLWTPETGNGPPNGSSGCLSPSSSNSTSCCSGNGSPTLGKHYRDSNCADDEKAESCILLPKTLKIDDPNEASKSPLRSTESIEPDQKDPVSKGTIFKTLETKIDGKDALGCSHILGANPAALSRSRTFQESS